mgnify:CR=1 FL=1|uniref:Uncharacterized protein n=1 Tax=Desulfobacca acetoxidans TaxID=60893 RepID=A0A7V4G6B2_9BACT
MPYKDPERRRAYDRRYKQERRRAASGSGSRPAEVRAYICQRYPHLRLPGGVSFHEGLLVTADPAVQEAVEQSPEFGQDVFRLALIL